MTNSSIIYFLGFNYITKLDNISSINKGSVLSFLSLPPNYSKFNTKKRDKRLKLLDRKARASWEGTSLS